MLIGYARVSTTEQETNLQLDALKRAGVEQVFSEKRSSAASRPMLAACIDHTRPGDTLMVYKIDRLARSLKDLLALLDRLDVRGVGFKSCTEPIDTTSPAGRMMMQMLGAFAEFERGMIRERTTAGLAAAKARGVKFGRARAMTPSEEREAVRKVAAGEMTKSGAARLYGCHISSIKRAMRRPENRPTKP
jgi:DNA invertase Pin-like site-specific DNA recombinase